MYKCQVPDCGRAFIQLSNLQQHLRSHVSQSERLKNRPFHCAICDRGFATESSMRTHNSKVCTTVNKNKKRLMVEPLQLRFVILPMLLQIWQLDKGPATVRNKTHCMDRQIGSQIVHYSKNFRVEYEKSFDSSNHSQYIF